jgi:hypothetical protein
MIRYLLITFGFILTIISPLVFMFLNMLFPIYKNAEYLCALLIGFSGFVIITCSYLNDKNS